MKICDGLEHVSAFRGTKEIDGCFYYVMDWYKMTLQDEIERSSRPLHAKKILQ